ncbi:MAG: hypothetical protein JWO42_3149 [Chloroflexi bacterium]|jgi:hypothetical protein|nr:hypothetical protein [Chloroflexota bacterium]
MPVFDPVTWPGWPDTVAKTATIREKYSLHVKAVGITREEFQAPKGMTLRKRLPPAEVAALTYNRADAMAETVANQSGGTIMVRYPEPGGARDLSRFGHANTRKGDLQCQ